MLPHTLFDILAALASFGMTIFVYRWRLRAEGDRIGAAGFGYALALVAGAGIGAYVFGTLNLLLSSHAGIGRSILGAYAGAVTTIEIYNTVPRIHRLVLLGRDSVGHESVILFPY